MKYALTILWLATSIALVAGCGSDSNSGSNTVDPSDPNALSQVIVIPGAERVEGNPPQSSDDPESPTITGSEELEVTSGGQTVIEVDYDSPSGYTECFVQVIGADDYFVIDVPNTATSGTIQIPVNVPDNVAAGSFDFYTCIAGENGTVSNAWATGVDVFGPLPPGGGGGGNGVVCASNDPSVGQGVQCPNGQLLDFCIDQNAGNCYYTVGAQRVNCGNCLDDSNVINQCVTQAAQLCI